MDAFQRGVDSKSDTLVAARLRNPAFTRELETLAETWFDQTVLLRLGGAGKLVEHPALLNNLRRGFGGALGRGASEDARAGRPCSWVPPCALDVFFREQLREGGDGLPKPMVVLADRDGEDLIVALRVFGFATDWLPAAEQAFIEAVREIVPWTKLGSSLPAIVDRQIETCRGLTPLPAPAAATLQWLTPLDVEKLDLAAAPWSVFTRLLRRIEGLARWCDAELVYDRAALSGAWRGLNYDLDALRFDTMRFWSGRNHRMTPPQDIVRGRMLLSEDLDPVWPLLLLGERTLVGRGAVQGHGRFHLV